MPETAREEEVTTRRRRRRQVPADGIWRQDGGGSLLVGDLRYPADCDYVRRFKAGRTEQLTLYCTQEAYFDLPVRATTVRELVRREGVVLGGQAWWLART